MSDIQTKSLGPLEIKDETKGEVEAIVATIGLVDHDGDVFLPGSVDSTRTVKLSGYGHDVVLDGKAPVGMGKVYEEGDKLILRGRFFMTTERGKESFHTVKELGGDGEWSVGFPNSSVKTARLTDEWRGKGARRLIEAARLIEASPVFQGAQVGTGTLAVKEAVREGVKEAAKDLDDEKRAEQEAEAKRLEEETANKQVEQEKAEAERVEAERKAAEETETKRLVDEAALKAQTDEAMEEYHRVQRTLKRLGVTS